LAVVGLVVGGFWFKSEKQLLAYLLFTGYFLPGRGGWSAVGGGCRRRGAVCGNFFQLTAAI
jgi:hypothetical protein